MSVEDFERRLTLAFVMATYVHITHNDPIIMIFGTIGCLVYPWAVTRLYQKSGRR